MKKLILIILAISIGIIYGIYFNSYLLNISLSFCIICCYLLFFRVNPKLKKYNRVYIFLILVIFFSFYSTYRYNRYENLLCENVDNLKYTCKILSYEKQGDKYSKYLAKITKIDNIKTNFKIYIYLNNDKYRYGDIIVCNLDVQKPLQNRNQGGFNNKLYCYSNNIYAICYAKNIYELSHKNSIIGYINTLKEYLSINILHKLNNQAGILISIILGDDKYLTNEEKEVFSDANLSYILVVSGTHLAYVILLNNFVLMRLRLKQNIVHILNIFVILFYLILNNFAISILRASIMYIINIIYRLRNKRKNNLNVILKLIILFLLINPVYFFNVSLILSFICVIVIELFSSRIDNKLQYNLNEKNNLRLRKTINYLSISITIQLFIIPILSIYFQKMYITSVFSSAFAIPVTSIIIILGIIYCLTLYIPVISTIISLILKLFIIILKLISIYFSNMPLSSINIYKFRWYEVILYYFVLYTIFINGTIYINLKLIIKYIIQKFKLLNKVKKCLICIFIAITVTSVLVYKNSLLKLYFIDVGQGDCTFIKVAGKNILIDGGNSTDKYDNGKSNILPFLLCNRVNKIDYMIVSHFDSDHVRRTVVHNGKCKS